MKKNKILVLLLITILTLTANSTVFAATGSEYQLENNFELLLEEENIQNQIDITNYELVKTGDKKENEIKAASLTPNGNLTLVDDVQGEQAEDKDFLTLQSKSGNIFYLIIDRAGEEENVYFLNLVDEADLFALIEGETVKPEIEVVHEQEVTIEEAPVETENSSPTNDSNPIMLFIILIVVGGIICGIFYYLKFVKGKNDVNGDTDIDDLFYDDEDIDNDDEFEYEIDVIEDEEEV